MFGDEDQEEGAAKWKDEDPDGAIIVRARRVKVKSAPSPIGGSAASVDEEEGNGEDTRSGEGPNGGNSTDSNPEGDINNRKDGVTMGGPGADAVGRTTGTGLPLENVRAVPLTARKRRVAFTPKITGTMLLELQDSGADTNYALSVASSDHGIVSKGRITRLAVTAGTRCVLAVELERDFEGTLRVVANAV
jgi:hypothetical protein